MADGNALQTEIIKAVSEIAKEHFGLRQGEGFYEGAPWYRAAPPRECWTLAEYIESSDPNSSRLFSAKYVARLIQDAVTDTVRRKDLSNVNVMVDRLFSCLDNTDQKKRYYAPISGVEFDGTLEIGPFRLQWMDDGPTEEAIRLVQQAIERTTSHTKHKYIEKRRIRREINKTLRGQPCFVYEDDGDTDRVEYEARRALPTLFDLLRYSVPADLTGRMERKIVIGFPVEGRPGAYQHFIVPLGKSGARYGGGRSPTDKLKVDDKQIRIMEQLGVFKIADTLKRVQTEFEADLLTAIHWFGESQTQPTPERELVDLLIAAESVVAKEHGKSHGVTDKMCEALAVLLKTDPAEREELFDFMKSSYVVRGNIVHNGMTETGQNNRLRCVVQEFVAAAIARTDDFQTRFELLDWIAKQKTRLIKRSQDRKPSKKQQTQTRPSGQRTVSPVH